MKCVYKIGRMYIVSEKLFHCFDSFLLSDLQYDKDMGCFFDAQGKPSEKPASFHEESNVLFIDFVAGEPDLAHCIRITTERDIDILRLGKDWVFSCNYGRGWLQITPDYTHATYFWGQPDEKGCTSTFSSPVLMAVQCSMLMHGYLIVHAACIETEGKAILFSAPSGVGKSTRANRWIEAYHASFISGDRPIIDPIRGKAFGAPWDGKESIYRQAELPIAAFNCIQRAERTKLTRMTADEKKRFLATQTFVPMWDPMLVARVFAGIRQMIDHVNIWQLACDRTIEAARECHALFFPEEPKNVLELLNHLKAMDTPKSEYRTYIDRFMDFKARKLGVPYYGTFELTPLCNLDCKMCYVHLQKQQMADCRLMSTEQWKAIIKEARREGMQLARITGGECLTYPGFDEVYLYLQELGVNITVLTNGLLLGEKKIAFFQKHPARLIQVTLYGSNDDAYEKVTGVRCFEQVYQNIRKAKEAGLPVTIAITPNAFAFQDLPDLLKLVERSGVPYHINSILNTPRENTGRELHDLTGDQYVEVFRLQARMHSELLQQMDASEVMDPPVAGKEEVGIKCGAGRSNFTISWNGRIIPCLALSDLYQSSHEKGFSNFREAWEDVNQWAETLPVPAECGACAYQHACVQCIAVHYDPEQKGHCNQAICQRTRKMVEAGLIRI